MGIESKYEYIYYTVINIRDWMRGNEEWFGDEFTWDEAINFVQHKLKTSEDESVKKYIVEYAQYCDDIGFWRKRHITMKKCLSSLSFSRTNKNRRSWDCL